MAKGIKPHVMTKLVLGIVFLGSLCVAIFVGYDRSSLEKSIQDKTGELESYKDQGLSVLTRERLKLEKQLNSLKDVNDQLNAGLFSSPKAKMPKESGDALKFKEELYRVQNKIKEEGVPIDFQFPFWLGFERYEHDIPVSADLPVRAKQLEIIKEIMDLMLQAKVPEVSSVEFLESKNVTYDGGKEPMFREFPVRISFKCKNDNLLGFLYKIYTSGIPFRVDVLKIKVLNEETGEKGELKVEAVIVAAIQQAEKT